MNENNVIEFASRRGATAAIEASARSAQRASNRDKEADALLDKLQGTKRMNKRDQSVLVSNLGRLIVQLDAKNRWEIVQNILLDNERNKRKRYIRFPNEKVGPSTPYAASGGTFARIIRGLINERVARGLDYDQAKLETVRDALKGTSFQRPSRFQLPEGDDSPAAAQLFVLLEKVFEKLAEEADVAEHFKLVAKYPIYPNCEWWWYSKSLTMSERSNPNNLYTWDEDSEEYELQSWIPWWAPKCLIGHLYLPFECDCLYLPEHVIAELEKACGGGITGDAWMQADCLSLIEPLVGSELIRQRRVYHRLPIWLTALPSATKLLPCLYAAIHRPCGFHPNEEYILDEDPRVPCFVAKVGEKEINDDATFFCGVDDEDEYDTFYVHASDNETFVIGSGIGRGSPNFKLRFLFEEMTDELPEWLYDQPVKRFLKLTMDSDATKLFALSQRIFPQRRWDRYSDNETVFRPAFSDPVTWQPLRQNTIGAFLLRNLTGADGPTIFDALKDDAIAKAIAARDIAESANITFQDSFNKRYVK